MLASLVSLLPACLSFGLFVVVVWRGGVGRRDSRAMAATFALGAVTGALAHVGIVRAEAVTGLSVRVADAGETGALVFFFLVAEPIGEAAKVIAVWPALLSRRLMSVGDGILMASSSALGFAAVEMSCVVHDHPATMWLVRGILAVPGHLFFACAWGAALGLARATHRRVPIFPLAFVASVVAHGLYGHIVYGRGPGSLLALAPLIAAMVPPTLWFARSLDGRVPATPDSRSGFVARWSRLSEAFPPPSFATVRRALAQEDEPLNVLWVFFGTLVVLGAIFVGVGMGVCGARWLQLNLAAVDDRTVTTAAPLLFLALGPFASLPVSGWLVARARGRHSLLEPVLSVSLALGLSVVGLGLVAPVAVVIALALSPLALVAAWAGARLGRAT